MSVSALQPVLQQAWGLSPPPTSLVEHVPADLVWWLASDFLRGWSPLTQFLFCFFFLMTAVIFCFPLWAPFSGCWTLIPRLLHILGDSVMSPFFFVCSARLFFTLFHLAFFLSPPYWPIWTYQRSPSGSGRVWLEFIYLYVWIYISGFFPLGLPGAACLLPQKVRALFQVVLCFQILGTAFTSHPFWLGIS